MGTWEFSCNPPCSFLEELLAKKPDGFKENFAFMSTSSHLGVNSPWSDQHWHTLQDGGWMSFPISSRYKLL